MTHFNFGYTKQPSDLTPSSDYMFWLPGWGVEATGTSVPDLSGNNAAAAAPAGLSAANLWATPGAFASIAGEDTGARIPFGKMTWDFAAGQDLLFSFWHKTAFTISDGFCGCFPAGGTGAGFRVRNSTTATKIIFDANDGTNNAALNPVDANVVSDVWNHIFVYLDAVTKLGVMYANAVETPCGSYDMSALVGDTKAQSGYDFTFGSDANYAAGQTEAVLFKDVHCIARTGGAPANLADIVKLLYTRPYYPLQDSDFA